MRLIGGFATLLWILCHVTGASAHASLVSSEPADGSVSATAPKAVELRFNEPVSPAVVTLIDAAGKTRGDVAVSAEDKIVTVRLPQDLPRGTQVISYRIISADGHPVGGSLLFSIGAASTAAALPKSGNTVAVLIWLTRVGVYLGLFVGVGGVFFAAWIGQGNGGGRIMIGALKIGLASAVVSVGLQGLDVLDLPLSAITAPATWTTGFNTSLGPALLIAIVSMAIAWLAWRSPTMTISWVLTSVAMLGVGVALAASGHAAAASPQWLTRPSLVLHGICVAYWAGALAPLAVMARRRNDTLPRVLNRFSGVAVPAVGLLALSGLVLAVIQLEHVSALVETRYGIVLLAKLALVVLLLMLAALNRFYLTPFVVADHGNTDSLRASITLECLLMLAIFAAVSTWRFTPPPRALDAVIEAPLAVHIHTDSAMFQVLVSPGAVGGNGFVLQLMNGDGSALSAKEATLILSLPERGIEPIERQAALGPDGYWHVGGVPLPYPGHWHMRIEALVTDFRKIALEDELDIPGH